MPAACKFCVLQDTETIPENSLIIQALQQIIKTLLKKGRTINNSNWNNSSEKIQDLQTSLKNLELENEKLKTDYSSLLKSSELFKHQYKRLEKEYSGLKNKQQSNLNHSEELLHGTKENKFPFAIDNGEQDEELKSIILAPDTCFADADIIHDGNEKCASINRMSPDSNKNSGFVKPEMIVYPKSCKTEVPIKSMEAPDLYFDSNIELTFDPDETCITVCKEQDQNDAKYEERSILIPASPILSGSSLKRSYCSRNKIEGTVIADDTVGSPSLLQSLTSFNKSTDNKSQDQGWRKIKKPLKQTALSKHSWNKKGAVGNSGSQLKNKSTEDMYCNLQSFFKKQKQAKSPTKIYRDKPISSENDGYSSLDELFDKTDGDLGTTTVLDETSLNTSKNIKTTLDEHFTRNNTAVNYKDSEIDDVFFNKNYNEIDVKSNSNAKVEISFPIEKEDLNDDLPDCSFDTAPKKSLKVQHKYQSVTRKREDREKLDTKACPQCEAYYSDLPPDVRGATMKEVCRHRYNDIPPSTPKHFWDIGIPSTSVCLERGYMAEEKECSSRDQQDMKEKGSKRRRRRPYEAKFETKQN